MEKLEWVEARTSNFEPLVAFYRDVLNLPVVFAEDDKDFVQFQIGSSGTYLALLGTRRKGVNFLPAIEVKGLDEVVADLREKQVRFVTEVKEYAHIRLIEFEDPDGNRLQLFEFK